MYALRRAGPDLAIGAGEMTWLGGVTQTLEEHGRLVGEAIRRIARSLGLEASLVEALGLAGEWHDAGKSRRVWQLAAGVRPGGPALAKSRRGRFRPGWLGGYRHEFASVADAERSLPADTPHRDLILHLIAAHHGWARPGFPRPEQWDPDASPAANRALAERIADRYARLSAEHGPWRLAWLEAILKAADAWVSSGRARVMEWRIDPENPAEVLACAGLAHLAWRSDRQARTGFVFGDDGEVRFEAPALAELSRPLELEEVEGGAVRLGGVELDWWLPWGLNSGLKTWSGKQTGWTVHRSLRAAAGRSAPGEWLTFEAPGTDRRKGRLGLDPASNWTTLELGWSPNQHSSVHMCSRPWVELLASVGLEAFALRRTGDGYRYHLWRAAALPAAVAAFGGRGRCVHSLAGYRVTTGRNGPNTVFRRASPLVGARP